MRKFLYGIFFTILLVSIVLNFALGFGFVSKNDEAFKANTNVSNLESKITSLESQLNNQSSENDNVSTLRFEDRSMEIKFDYPSDWNLLMDTMITEEFAYEPIYGRIAQDYIISVGKNGSRLQIINELSAVDGFPDGFKTGEMDYVEVNNDVMRIADKNSNGWNYVSKADCAEMSSELIDLSEFDVCYTPFAPQISKFPVRIEIESKDSEILKEADSIILSAI